MPTAKSKRMPPALHISFRLPTVVGKTIFRTLIAIGLKMRLKTTHFVSPAENTLGFTHTKIAQPPPLPFAENPSGCPLCIYINCLVGWAEFLFSIFVAN